MDLKEAKEITNTFINNVGIEVKTFELKEAISTILQELDKLQKENEEYSKQMDLDYVDENFVSKDKIREKIEKIKNKPNNPNQKVIATQIDASLIACLQDLLKEE